MKSETTKTRIPFTGIILTLIGVLFSIATHGQCTHTIRLTDTYGDGWNGGTVTVTVNGTPVLTDITLATGYGPEDHAFTASTGDVINITRTNDGTYPWEMRVAVLSGAAVLLAVQEPQNTPGVSFTACCPGMPDNATYVSPANGVSGLSCVTLTWSAPPITGCNAATSYDVYFGTNPAPPFVGNTASLSWNTGVLSVSTTYYWRIVSKNASGDAVGAATWSFTTGSSPCATCNHIIRLTDTFGDGWNGGTITVTVNGIPVLTNITLAAGFGPEDHVFSAAPGDIINIVRTAGGSFPSEMRIQVLDNVMSSLLGPVEPQATPGHNVNGSCNTCAAPATVTASVSANDVTPGTAVTFSYISHTGGLCSGSWEYQWETTGGTVLQPWSTSQNYLTTATNDMFVILKMRCSDCPLQTATSNVLSFNVLIPPVNDFPCDAILLSTYTSCSYQWESNSDATDSGIPSPGCASYSGADVWYKTVVGGSGNLLVQTDAGTITDGGLAIYSGTCNSLTLIECNNNSGPGNMEKILQTGLNPGDTIWIRVWRNGGGTGTFQICASDPRYILNGSSQEAPQYGPDCVIITQNSPSQGACVWNSTGLIDFSQTFDYEITVYLGDNDGGADGITFTFHRDPSGLTACGTNGGHLGMLGVSPSWSVEIDTYDNGWVWHDIFDDHIAIFANGDNSLPLIAGPVSATNPPSNIEDGNTHLLRIVWDPASMLFSVYFDGQLRLSVTYDIINSIFGGDPMVYWGFTGSTGMQYNLQYFCPNDLPLPLTFVQFAHECNGQSSTLSWITASEQNTQVFYIEKSYNGYVWEHIDFVGASGNTNQLTNYTYTLTEPENEVFYRIKEVDVDGKTFYSGSLFAQCSDKSSTDPLFYPNPADDELYVEYCYEKQNDKPVSVRIFDMTGRIVHSQTISSTSMCLGEKLHIGHLSKGSYLIVINDGNKLLDHTTKIHITK